MKLPRPYIPLWVRVEVARRQLWESPGWEGSSAVITNFSFGSKSELKKLLFCLFGNQPFHLDHDPPLMLRKRRRNGTYVPDANDPAYLVYRSKEDHRTKTFVRGDGAQRSDIGQRRYLKRVQRNRDPQHKKQKIAQRKNFKWPKRKIVRTK